jgi:hypothetical protein
MSTDIVTRAADVPFSQIERMAAAVAKSGMFAVKTPEGALTLMLIAQAEGVAPAQAMMDYDLIQNKPCLKSAAMLARFQRAGGKIKWLHSDDAVASAEFSHPAGGTLTITWDQARIEQAGLASREMHKKFPAQMKRARCISEGIRAIAPQCIPAGLYAVEEVQDMVDVTPAPVSENAAVAGAANALTADEVAEHIASIQGAADLPALTAAFSSAWKHSRDAKDTTAQAALKQVYDARKAELVAIETEVM